MQDNLSTLLYNARHCLEQYEQARTQYKTISFCDANEKASAYSDVLECITNYQDALYEYHWILAVRLHYRSINKEQKQSMTRDQSYIKEQLRCMATAKNTLEDHFDNGTDEEMKHRHEVEQCRTRNLG